MDRIYTFFRTWFYLGLALTASMACVAQQQTPDTTSTDYRILKAVETGDVNAFQKLISSNPALIKLKEPARDEPLLLIAVRNNQPGMVDLLMEKGADVNTVNRSGNNALHLAAFTGNYNLMEMLMSNGADYQISNARGRTPVEYVSYGKNPQVFKLFLEKDPNILFTKTAEGATLLHFAASAGDTAGFTYLLGKGLDIKTEDDNGANVMHWAMSGGEKAMLGYLSVKGLDYHFISSRGFSPITAAMMYNAKSSVEFLLEHEMEINQHFPPENNTLLIEACNSNALEIANYLIGLGADIDAEDANHFTALSWAVINRNRELARLLVEKNADVNHTCNNGASPFLLAVERDSLPMIQYIAAHGADVGMADTSGMTALHRATISNKITVVEYLLSLGIPVDAKNNDGMTALHYASIYGRQEIGKMLVQQGASPGFQDNKGHSPVYYSALYGHKELNEMFIGITDNHKEMLPLSPGRGHGEAVIHYLNNSGFAIETANHLLIFDYYHFYPAPDDPSLLNGRINPDELKGKKVVVFASHVHGDHYDTTIWNWGAGNSGIRYVMGFKPVVRHRYDYADPHSELKFDGITINPIRSTDSGEGFLVEADGIVIYHPGDHINKESGLAADFKGEIDYLAGLEKSVDIAFFPVNGCGFPDAGIVKNGNIYVIETLNPRLCIAMHAGDHECKAFIAGIESKFPGKQTASGTFPGDRFIYLKE